MCCGLQGCDAMYSPVGNYGRFGGNCCFHLVIEVKLFHWGLFVFSAFATNINLLFCSES